MIIADQSLVTVYADIMAFLLVLGLYYMFHQYRIGRGRYSDRIFNLLCVSIMVNAASNGFSYAMHQQHLGWAMPIKLLAPTIAELSTALVLFLWMLYIDYKLYESHDRIFMLQRYFSIPLLVFTVLCIINLFTGFMFYMDDNMMFVAKPLFYALTLLQYAYGILPIVVVIHYVRFHGRPHFLHISPLVVPVAIASLFTLFSNYSARAFGFAVALVLLHFSNVNKWRYDDADSGFYNREYVGHILDLIRDGKAEYKGAVVFESDSTNSWYFEMLRGELPKESTMIRVNRNKLVLLTENATGSIFTLLKDLIEDEVDEYDSKKETLQPIRLKISNVFRMSGETASEFVKRVVA